jgi:hypothetical protein
MGRMADWGILGWAWTFGAFLLAFLMWATQVNPKQAVSNLSEWVATFGLRNQPAWLKSPDADRIVRNLAGAAMVFMALAATFLFLGAGNLGFWQQAAVVVGFTMGACIFLSNITDSVAETSTLKREGTSAYWTLTEAVSWIAFGEAVQTKDWYGLIQKIRATPAEERVRIDAVERLLIERLRDPSSGIDIQGKEAGDTVHKPIPHNVFLSNVGLNVFDSRIGLPLRADLQTMLDWKGPNWTDVLVRQAHVRSHWKADIGQQTVSFLDAAKQAYGRTRGTLVAAAAEARIGNEDRKPGTITWICYALADRITIYGYRPPADHSPEKIKWARYKQRYSFRMEGGDLILREHSGDESFEHMYVLAAELPKAIAEVAAISPEQMSEPQDGPQ